MTETAVTVSGAHLPSRLAEFPDRIRLEKVTGCVIVKLGDLEIARSKNAVRLHEGDYAPVIYVPRGDANMSALARTDHSTFCPLKGEASYFSVIDGSDAGVNAAWTYEDPFVPLAQIKDHLAFYADRICVTEE